MLTLNRTFRRYLLIFIGLLITGLSAILIYQIAVPRYKDEPLALMNYKGISQANYRVYLKPNPLYNDSSLGEDENYFLAYTEQIKVHFTNNLALETKANYDGSYEILGIIEGYKKEGQTENSLWQKTVSLVPNSSIKGSSNGLNLEKDVFINLAQYNSFVENVMNESQVDSEARLKVVMNTNLRITTNHGIINKKLAPTVIIPLQSPIFNITKDKPLDLTGAIQKTTKVRVRASNKLLLTEGVFTLILLVALSLLLLFTKNDYNQHTSEVNKIIKKYGDRLVAIADDTAIFCETIIRVKTIDDLVKVADELGQPIIYRFNNNPKLIKQFFVLTELISYIYELRVDVATDVINPAKFSAPNGPKTTSL